MSVVAPLVGLLIYPTAKWLFAFVLTGVAVLLLNRRFAKDPTPQQLADEIERLLTGNCAGWDVDDFEMRNIRDPQVRELWAQSLSVDLPERWVRASEDEKNKLRDIIRRLRELGKQREAKTSRLSQR